MGMNGYSVRPKNKPSPGLRRVTVLWAAPTWPALIGWLSSWTAPGAWRAWRKWWIAGSIRPACVLRSITSSRNVRAFTTPIRATNWNTAAIFCSKAAGNWTRSIKGSLTARAECWTCPGSRLGVVKARTLLLFPAERKTQAGRIDPAIHHLCQARQASGAVQLLSQPIKAGQVGAAHKTVTLLNPGHGLFLGLTLYPFMPIERNLQAKGRMTAHFNAEVSPLRVDNVEMVVIDQPPVFGPPQHHFAVAIIFGLSNQGRSFGNENGKHPSELGIGGAKFLGLGVLGVVADSKVTQRDFMFASISMHAPGKVPRQLAQSLLTQRRVGKESVPPGQKTSARLAQREVAGHGNAIHTVVRAGE